MIVIDKDMPTTCKDCFMMCADVRLNNTERPKDCPIKCDIEQIKDEIKDRLYVNSPIFRELIDYRNGKIPTDDVIEKFNQVTRQEILRIIDKYTKEDKK